jgi:hypothetical protein
VTGWFSVIWQAIVGLISTAKAPPEPPGPPPVPPGFRGIEAAEEARVKADRESAPPTHRP